VQDTWTRSTWLCLFQTCIQTWNKII